FVASKDSHNQYKHTVKSGKVTVPNHKGDIPPIGTVKAILKQAGLK
ncbi:type II toxin-antitoxin system HicA family toxin, partial [Treponema denticola]